MVGERVTRAIRHDTHLIQLRLIPQPTLSCDVFDASDTAPAPSAKAAADYSSRNSPST